MAGQPIVIDTSPCADLIAELRRRMTPEKFNQRMYSVMQRTSRHVSNILKADLPKEYKIRRKGDIGRAVQRPQMQNNGMSVGCVIPIKAPRGKLGPGKAAFAATNGRRGWNTKKKYKIKVKVLQSGAGTLPENVKSYGNQPPFRNLSAGQLNNLVFTREGQGRLPIVPVTGIAIPQMVSNRSEDQVKKDILDYFTQRLIHELEYLIQSGH